VSIRDTSRGITGTTHETSVLDVEGRNWTEPDDTFCDSETTMVDAVRTMTSVLDVEGRNWKEPDDISTIAIQVTLLTRLRILTA